MFFCCCCFFVCFFFVVVFLYFFSFHLAVSDTAKVFKFKTSKKLEERRSRVARMFDCGVEDAQLRPSTENLSIHPAVNGYPREMFSVFHIL